MTNNFPEVFLESKEIWYYFYPDYGSWFTQEAEDDRFEKLVLKRKIPANWIKKRNIHKKRCQNKRNLHPNYCQNMKLVQW